MLVYAGIERLIDVRNNPVARRYGFHKSTLERLTGNLGIEYRHFPELAIKSEQRRDLRSKEDYRSLFDEYEQTTVLLENAAVDAVSALIREKASVLVCMEKAQECCHRSRLERAYRSSLLSQLSTCSMNERTERTRVLITVMTYPHPSERYQELVCTAGVTEDGKWVRL